MALSTTTIDRRPFCSTKGTQETPPPVVHHNHRRPFLSSSSGDGVSSPSTSSSPSILLMISSLSMTTTMSWSEKMTRWWRRRWCCPEVTMRGGDASPSFFFKRLNQECTRRFLPFCLSTRRPSPINTRCFSVSRALFNTDHVYASWLSLFVDDGVWGYVRGGDVTCVCARRRWANSLVSKELQ